MKLQLFLLILLSVSISAVAQIVLKTGASDPAVIEAIDRGNPANIAMQFVTNRWVLGGLALYFGGAVIWLFVLARIDVSYAYPFVGVGFILTMLLGRVLLGDVITASRLLGTLLVSAGVVLIART